MRVGWDSFIFLVLCIVCLCAGVTGCCEGCGMTGVSRKRTVNTFRREILEGVGARAGARGKVSKEESHPLVWALLGESCNHPCSGI